MIKAQIVLHHPDIFKSIAERESFIVDPQRDLNGFFALNPDIVCVFAQTVWERGNCFTIVYYKERYLKRRRRLSMTPGIIGL